MNAKQIKKIIENNKYEYNYFGLRAMTRDPMTGKYPKQLGVGDETDNSYAWEDGEPTEDELNGTCALGIDRDAEADEIEAAIKNLRMYDAKQVVLIGSRYQDYGSDEGEVIMSGWPTVLATWKI